MKNEVKNLEIAEARRQLEEQLRPRSERPGENLFEGDFEAADAELERLSSQDREASNRR